MSALPPLYVELRAMIGDFQAKMGLAKKELGALEKETGLGATGFQKFSKYAAAAGVVGLGMMALGAYRATKAAADYQTKLGVIYSTTGEVKSKSFDLGQQLLDLGSQVGYSGDDMAKAFYYVASGGYHAADGIKVMRAASQGAKIEGSDLTEVTHALTGVMAEYHMKASSATAVTSAMTTAVGHGMMTFNDLALALPRVGSRAAAAHVTVQELLGAMATMTRTGLPASVAATYLGQTIGHLEAPSAKARTEMKGLGIDANKLAETLGSGSGHGLTDSIGMLYKGIMTHLSPAGMVAVKTFAKSKGSASDYKKMLANLPDSMQTVVGAVATMSGGVKGLQGTLMLGGKNLGTFRSNVKAVADSMHHSGKNVDGWAAKQKTLNQKVDEAKAAMKNLQIEIGNDLLPIATKFLGWVAKATQWLEKHKLVVEIVAIALGVVLVAALYSVAAAMIAATWEIMLIIIAIGLIIFVIVAVAKNWREAWNKIKEIAVTVGRAIGDFVVMIWNWIKSHTISIWNAVKNAIVKAWHSVANFFVGAWHKVTDPIVKAWHWVEKETSKIWNGIKAFFKKWWPLLLVIFAPEIAFLVSIWNHFHKQITDTVHKVWNAIKKFFSTIWSNIKGNAKADWDAIKKYIVDPIEWVWHRIESVLGFIWHVMKAAWSNIKSNVSADWHAIKTVIGDVLGAIWRAIKGRLDGIKRNFTETFNNVKSWLSGIVTDFYNIGVNIVQGIINGLASGGGIIKNTVQNLANDALSAAKSFLGINSPSKVFSKIIGGGIVEGIVHGVDSNSPAAQSSIGRLASNVTNAWRNPLFKPFTNSASILPGAGSYGGTNQPMVINLNVKGEVDGQQLFKIVQSESLRWGKSNGRSAFAVGTGF